MKPWLTVAALLLLFEPHGALAQEGDKQRAEEQREEEMFGEEATGDEPGIEPLDSNAGKDILAEIARERLAIGGMLYLRFGAAQAQQWEGPTLSSPSLMDLYLDARPSDRVRGYARGRLTYNPLAAAFLPGITPEPETTTATLDQLFMQFDVGRWLFLTVGKQPVRWGTGRIWNPVDAVNASRKDPLALFDERTGVSMVKAQIPLEALGANLVALLMIQGEGQWDDLGAALRFEKTLWTAEMGLSAIVTQRRDALTLPQLISGDQPGTHGEGQFGLDLSAGIWELDVTAEAAVTLLEDSLDVRRQWFVAGDYDALLQASVGASYTWKYDAQDYLLIGAEYFYNRDGRADKDQYLEGLLTGALSPFYMGRHYLALYLALPMPGNWNNTTFLLSNIANLSDGSGTSRLDVGTDISTWIRVEWYLSGNWGTKGGEFRFGLEETPLAPGVSIPYPLFSTGLNFRMSM